MTHPYATVDITDICAIYIIHRKLETVVSSILLDMWDNAEMLTEEKIEPHLEKLKA